MSAYDNWIAAGKTAPIIWMPMKDGATCHKNYGTGGDFVLNGTVATSEVGATWSCKASKFDGVADYLSRTISIPNKRKFILSFWFKSIGGDSRFIEIADSLTGIQPSITFTYHSKSIQYIQRSDATLPTDVTCTKQFVVGKWYHGVWLLDIDTPLNSKLYLDGVLQTLTVSAGGTHLITNTSVLGSMRIMGAYNGSASVFSSGYVGELYADFIDTLPDLSTSNPFWDTDTNRPKPVRQVIAETGITPLIAMPLDASNAGKNYGSGGDFVANSAPYIGSRGASEFWCRSILVDATKYLTYTGGLFCASLVKWVSTDSGVTWAVSYLNNVTVTNIGNGTDNGRVAYYFGTSEVINWALEVNKLRFTDGLGYPIQPTIDNNTLLYLAFNNPTNFGKNDGSGNDLIITGTVTQSSDVKA